ncbi:MAG: flagellar biosynthetic protein FliO [Halanaerobiaceae bacterium]|nr:flagellar biosynthetic protein FliO [Halanaerobiaceae bacterium]
MENIGEELARVVFYLVLVIALMYLFSYFLKRSISGKSRGRYIQVIEQVYLAPKKSLALVRVHDQILLLSNSETEVKVLFSWKEEDFPEPAVPGSEDSFKAYLDKFTKANRRGRDEKK